MKWFQTKSNLNLHLKAHNKRAVERMFTCGTCGETFHNRALYNAHIPTTHSTAQPAKAHKRPAGETTDAPAAKQSKRTQQASANTASEPVRTSAAAASSSWEVDHVPFPSNLVPSSETDIADVHSQQWPQNRTRFSHQNRSQDWYNFHLSTISPTAFRKQLIFSDQSTVFKISFALVLFCAIQKLALSSTTTLLPITTWCWNNLFLFLIKLI